jgi:hypothetical protein
MAETVASYSIPEAHVYMFTDNIRATIARAGGLVYPYVSMGSYVGERVQVVNFIGPVEFIQRDTPYADTKLTELEHTSRWINGFEYDVAVLIDRLDTLKMIYDPTNPYVDRFRQAHERKRDQIVVDSFFLDAKAGKDANIVMSYKAANTVPSGTVGTTPAGFTTAKLRALRKLMKKRNLDLRTIKPIILVTSEAIDDLIGDTNAAGQGLTTSSDYAAIKALVDGEISYFMGFQFQPFEDYNAKGIPYQAGSTVVRQSPAWIPDGMHYGTWQDLVVTISNRPDKNNIKQIHATFTAGAVRLEEDKVFAIAWDETAP